MKKDKILLIDGGARGHAIAWKLREDPAVGEIVVVPGNAGTAMIPSCRNIDMRVTDIEGLLHLAHAEKPYLTFVGQEDALAAGIVDVFEQAGHKIFGPTRKAAQMESSKVFAGVQMESLNIKHPNSKVFVATNGLTNYLSSQFSEHPNRPVVLKVDGLAQGKGVYICHTYEQAKEKAREILVGRLHGNAGMRVIVQEYLDGFEVSAHAFTDGKTVQMMPFSQDYKALQDGGKGPNTGGMGVIAPVPTFNDHGRVGKNIVAPMIKWLGNSGMPYKGVLYPGLMITSDGEPNVLEFNARFGDPETQALIRLLKTPLFDVFDACVNGMLETIDIKWEKKFVVVVTLASEGYPSSDYKKGALITGIQDAEKDNRVKVFHAGTKLSPEGVVSSGGRVLSVSAVGNTPDEANEAAYIAVSKINFDGKYNRNDIGAHYLSVAGIA